MAFSKEKNIKNSEHSNEDNEKNLAEWIMSKVYGPEVSREVFKDTNR